jgi:hypothetical protein
MAISDDRKGVVAASPAPRIQRFRAADEISPATTVAGLASALNICADIFEPAENAQTNFKTCGYDTV